MKKLLIISNALLLGIIFFIACNPKDTKKSNNTTLVNLKPQCSPCYNYEGMQVPGIINGALLQQLSQDYLADQGKSKINYNSLSGASLGDDALWLTFDLEKMKNFIWHIDSAVCKANCFPKPTLGIRFYYIKYPQGVDTSAVPEDLQGVFAANANKHALAMVPVYKLGNEWYDFDYNSIGEGCTFDRLSISLNKHLGGVICMGEGDNHGGIGPPPFPGTYPINPPE